MCETRATSDKHTCNIRLEKQLKHWKQKLATYVYKHCDICNIPIYFCNFHMKHLQRLDETSETLETYFLQYAFSVCNVTLLLGRITGLDAAAAHGAPSAPLGEDLLGGLWVSTCSEVWANTPWAWQRTGLAWWGMEAPQGDGGGGAPEWPGMVGARALHLQCSRAPWLARPATEHHRRQASDKSK
jgi:hypothetical protein